jgi:hypothetical protein
VKLHIIGVKNLTVEVDVKYIKGMINNPDMHPNAAVNRWIAAILVLSFKLVHVPGKEFVGPDGLSRRRRTKEDEEEDEMAEAAEQWVEDLYLCGLWIVDNHRKWGEGRIPGVGQKGLARRGNRSEETSVLAFKRKGVEATEDGDRPREAPDGGFLEIKIDGPVAMDGF